MKLFLAYLDRQKVALFLFSLLFLTFSLVYVLYGLPAVALTYALCLCLFFGGTVFLCGFFSYRARHRALEQTMAQLQYHLDSLPEPWDLVEQDYQQLLKSLRQDKAVALGELDRRQKDREDYFTLWFHQIKTPISAIGLLLQKEDSVLSRDLGVQLFKIEQYVQMVLAYLRMDSQSTDYVLRPCPLEQAVRKSVRKFAPLFIHGRVSLDLRPMDLCPVTDEKWLCFALEQLLSNAIKYTPQGTITLFQDGPSLCVKDTGLGIAPEDLPRICEKGYTGYNGRADQKASGIGLYLCSRILENLGHQLTFVSQPGKGTTARIIFDMEERTFE